VEDATVEHDREFIYVTVYRDSLPAPEESTA